MIDNSKILIVGGSFSETGGSVDSRINTLFASLDGAMIMNGGMPDFLKALVENRISEYKIVYWMPTEDIPDVEALITKDKKMVIKNSKETITSEDEAADFVKNHNCHAVISFEATAEGPLVKVFDISGNRVLNATDFSEVTESLKDEKTIKAILNAVPKVSVSTEPTISMERLHLRVVDDTIDILYRPVHSYIEFVKNDDEGKERIKKLALMSRDEFSKYLDTEVLSNVSVGKTKVMNLKGTHDEEWFVGAWKVQTDKLLEELGVENPIEEPIWR